MKRRCIEGYWVGGIWMPPALYFYVNFGTIRVSKSKYSVSNVKVFGRPWLRDLEWQIFRYYTEARGFSGFELDDEYSSNRALLDEDLDDETLFKYFPSTQSKDGKRKKYISARENIEKIHHFDKGRALYENPVQNLMMMGSRETGKTYAVGVGMILHSFLFDGLTEYTEEAMQKIPPIDLIVGAEHSNFTNNMMQKIKEALENLPGEITHMGRKYPSPFTKSYVGSWGPGKGITHSYEKKYPGGWKKMGTQSSIFNRTFNENAFAAQGTRAYTIVLEEVGMFSNLKEVFMNTVDNMKLGGRKIGMLMLLGTGGDMQKGTIDASEMFYSPQQYDILPFKDTWENKGDIGFFIPAYLALNEFKDDNGYSDMDKATKFLKSEREKKKGSSGGSEALNKEIQYRPIVPSEMFLARTANVFPTAELQRRLTEVKTSHLYELSEKVVDLYFDSESPFGGVSYQISHTAKPINTFPYNGDDTEGAVVIYEFPQAIEGSVLPGSYVIGCDPYKDDSATGGSLASIYVMKTNKYFATIGHNEIVASYVGRPYLGKNYVNEILYKLALFYNAKIYFENAVGNIKDYFEKIRKLEMLALQPVTVFNRKASFASPTQAVYGYPMSNAKVKWEALQYLRTWLLTPREGSEDDPTVKRNLDFIIDPALLQELLAFNMEGNFDRVMGLVGCILGLEESHNINLRRDAVKDSELSLEFNKFIVKNKKLFYEVS